MPSLVVVAPGPLRVRDGQFWTDAKLLSGMRKYAELFPGEVSLLGTPAIVDDTANLGGTAVDLDSIGFELTVAGDLREVLERQRHDVALLPLTPHVGDLMNLAVKDVVAAEHTGSSRLSMALASPHSIVDRLRMELGFRRLGRRLADVVKSADGVQCNGEVAWRAYAPLSKSAVRVYDNRITPDLIDEAVARHRPYTGGRLRLGFTGRLMAIKGPEYAAGLPTMLAALGVDASLDVFGDGPNRQVIEKTSDERVRWHGAVFFPDEWCTRVVSCVDVMVLPHVQGDPSGSYLESAGMGIPVLGFDNAQLRSLVAEGSIGWTVPMRRIHALAGKAADLARHPEVIEAASAASFDFVRRHHFEADFANRVDHLVQVSRLR